MSEVTDVSGKPEARSPFRLDGEVGIITGGGSGLGFGMAQAMIDAGASVVLTGRRETVLQQAVQRLGERASFVVADVTHHGSAPEVVSETLKHYGTLTILVNNAGVHLKKQLEHTSAQEFDTVMQTHVNGAFALCREVTPIMKQQRHGHILFIASMASFIGLPEVIAYSAAKAAHTGMVRSLAVELGEHGIRVNAIAPGWTESDMLHQALDADPGRKQKILARIPGGAFGLPQDIGYAAVYLSSPAARYVSGVVLPVDGGALVSL